jgi:Tol biopolymer transport system component
VNDLPERGFDILTGRGVPGTLLAELLDAGPLDAAAALRCAVSIGKALGRVHDRGLVHGSLSPWSIVVGEHGTTILRPVAPDAHAHAYTSPEQLRGRRPDARSDVFAFGAILYEIAAGSPAFGGEPAAIRAAILHPPAPRLAAAPPALAAIAPVVADCLQQDPLRRRQRLPNVVAELKLAARFLVHADHPHAPLHARAATVAAAAEPVTPAAPRSADAYWSDVFTVQLAARRAARMRLLGFGAILLAVAAASLFAGKLFFHRRQPAPMLRFLVSAEAKSNFRGGAAISPDGRYLAFTADDADGHRMLWLRALDEMHARVVPGTDDAAAPFWSPDSGSVGYFAARSLKIWKMELAADGSLGGGSHALCPADTAPGGGTWNRTGTIVFSPGLGGGLYRINSSGGDPQVLLPLDTAKEHRSYRWPHFLPDGRHFTFYTVSSGSQTSGVYSGDLEARESHPLFTADSDAVYAGDFDANPARFGYLFFVLDGGLYTQGFDPSILALEGKPALFQPEVGAVATLSLLPLSVSSTGLLAYQTLSPPTHQLAWLDRDGKQTAALGEPGEWGLPRIAPDGRRVVCARLTPDAHRGELWLFGGDTPSRLVSIPGADARSPVWSPDGTRVAFTANPSQLYDVYVKTANSAAPAEPLFHTEYTKYLTDWARDGRYLMFSSYTNAGASSDVWAYSVADHRAGPVLDTIRSEAFAALSPNGRWMAYQSDEGGRDQVYVQAFDGIVNGTKRRWQISTAGGRMPRWRADGRELFFLAGPGSLMVAPVTTAAADFAFEPARALFETRAIPRKSNLYDVSPDGQRVLMNLPYEWAGSSSITMVTNWMQKLANP